MELIYIHGANASINSFNYLREHLDGMCLSYDSNNGFKNNLEIMKNMISSFNDIVFVGHSLGGIYALHLAAAFPEKVILGVTLSTPYGGHPVADYARAFFPFNILLSDISPRSWAIRSLDDIEIKWPWINVVTTAGGIPWLNGPNDGVVTLESMKHRSKDMRLVAMSCNHYEIVQSSSTIEIIRNEISGAMKGMQEH